MHKEPLQTLPGCGSCVAGMTMGRSKAATAAAAREASAMATRAKVRRMRTSAPVQRAPGRHDLPAWARLSRPPPAKKKFFFFPRGRIYLGSDSGDCPFWAKRGDLPPSLIESQGCGGELTRPPPPVEARPP